MKIGTLDHGHTQIITLPASEQGLRTLKARLCALGRRPIRLAVCGSAALAIALALSQTPVQDVYIVAPSFTDQPVALAHYASRTI